MNDREEFENMMLASREEEQKSRLSFLHSPNEKFFNASKKDGRTRINPFTGLYVYNPHCSHSSSDSDNGLPEEQNERDDHCEYQIENKIQVDSESASQKESSQSVVQAESSWSDSHSHSNSRALAATTAIAAAGERDAPSIDSNVKKMKCIKVGSILALLTLILVVLALAGTGIWQQTLKQREQDNYTNENQSTPTTTSVPTLGPSADAPFPWESLGDYHESLLQTVLAIVNGNSNNDLLDINSWTTRGTPQFEALRFIAYQDGQIFEGGDMGYFHGGFNGNDTPLLLQRLALLILYYQTGGGFSWTRVPPVSISNGNDRRRQLFMNSHDDYDKASEATEYSDDSSGHIEGWASPGVDECYWDGVVCNAKTYRVTHLILEDRALVGSIPIETWLWLPHLIIVNLSNNRLTGTLPHDVFWPFSIESYSDSRTPSASTAFSKKIHLTHLQQLDLSFNKLEGSLPVDLTTGLPSLQILNLGHNRLTGLLPRNYRRNALEQLYLSSNKLTGTLPMDQWFLPPPIQNNHKTNSLLLIDIDDNLLSGTIAASLGNHHFLEFLSLQNNPLLSGSLPSPSIFSKLQELQILQVSDCNIEGSLTSALGALLTLPNLERLSLAGNQLTGSLPTLTQIREIHNGSLPPTMLKVLNLGNNAITGTIPPDLIGDHLVKLGHLQLFGNNLAGTIPHSRFYPSVLSVFWIQDNPNLVGTMPCNANGLAESEKISSLTLDEHETSEFLDLPNTSDDSSSSTTTFELESSKNINYGGNDYRADCSIPATVECPCCRRCF